MKRYTVNVDCCFNESVDEAEDGPFYLVRDVEQLLAAVGRAKALLQHALVIEDNGRVQRALEALRGL